MTATSPVDALRAALATAPLLGFKARGAGGLLAKTAFVGMADPYLVTSTSDDANAADEAGTLRYALAQNESDGGGHTITFDPSIAGGTINLSSTLTISSAVTIDGGGNNVTISGQNAVTDFTLSNGTGSTVEIDNLTIANGNGHGSSAPPGLGPFIGVGGAAGGGIYAGGNLTLNNDTFINNTATGGSGSDAGSFGEGNDKGAGAGGNAAGAVYVASGTVSAANLTFVNDTATPGAGGAGDTAHPDPGASGTASPISNNTAIRDAATCFATGTCILTARGQVAVENLTVGDLAVTASGEHRPVRWIGHRTLDRPGHPRPHEVLPVRIRAGALGEGRPIRDLVVSPGHGIALDLLGEVILTAGSLVNGSTIVQEEAERVTYWHVELDSHDLLVAEGQAAESYLDMGNRAFFAQHTGEGALVDLAASPDADPAGRTHVDFCRPFHGDGPVLAFARKRIEARAKALGWHLSGDEPWAGVHLLADGVRVEPEVRGHAARFQAPAGARDLWLVSPAASPCDLDLGADGRRLGLYLAELRVGDGWDARAVALDDTLLCAGFHHVEGEPGAFRRWTAGCARLPAAMWAGEDRTLVLRLDASSPALPRWVDPQRTEAAEVPVQPALRLVHAA